MRRWRRGLLLLVGLLLLLFFLGPFLIPPLRNTLPPEQLAYPDSRFIEVNGITLHYRMQGQGEPTFVLLHGLAGSTFSWREVMAPLAERGTVIAFDRPSSGLTERPLPGEWQGESPYSRTSQVEQTIGLLDALGKPSAILVGHSAGGAIAALTALRYPERVQALVLVDAAIYTEGGAPAWLLPVLRLWPLRGWGVLVGRSLGRFGDRLLNLAWHDPSRIPPGVWEGYSRYLRVQNWDRALWELTLANRSADLPRQLGRIGKRTLVVTGDDDRIVPTAQSIRLAQELPNASLVVIPDCGHIPHEERPEAFLTAIMGWLDEQAATARKKYSR